MVGMCTWNHESWKNRKLNMDRTLEQFSMITSIKSSEHAWRDHIGWPVRRTRKKQRARRSREEADKGKDDMKSCINDITHYLAINLFNLSTSLSNVDHLVWPYWPSFLPCWPDFHQKMVNRGQAWSNMVNFKCFDHFWRRCWLGSRA